MNFQSTLAPVHTHNGTRSPTRLAPLPDWNPTGKSEHFVQFYEEDSFLVQSLARFIAPGLQQGEAAVVIATKAHRDALDERLRQEGLDPDAAQTRGHYVSLDAVETLSRFMLN